MNYYDRVQRSIDCLEANLYGEISPEEAAREAFMSTAAYYRIFFALTGRTVKAYVRLRRLSEAARRLCATDEPIMQIALDCGFESQESFTRAFKQAVGTTPAAHRRVPTLFQFERMNLMERYFAVQEPELLERYPEIKVLKELPAMRVAYYRHVSATPEGDAGRVLFDYARRTGLDAVENGTRYFGFNNPNPSEGNPVYGYEMWATLPEAWVVDDPLVKEKTVQGGLYAVTSAPSGGECPPYWARLVDWVKHSSYDYGSHQWLEEHLWNGLPTPDLGVARLDLYMPIRKREPKAYQFVDLPATTVASLRVTGPKARNQARERFWRWAEENGFLDSIERRRLFAFYDWQHENSETFYYEICMTVDEGEPVPAPFVVKTHPVGRYAVDETTMIGIGQGWMSFMKWIESHPNLCYGTHQWFEEYLIRERKWDQHTGVRLHLAVRNK